MQIELTALTDRKRLLSNQISQELTDASNRDREQLTSAYVDYQSLVEKMVRDHKSGWLKLDIVLDRGRVTLVEVTHKRTFAKQQKNQD